MWLTLTQRLLKYPFLLTLALLALVFAAGYGLPQTKVTSDFEVFFGADHPQLKVYHEIQNTYSKTDNVFFVIAPKDKQVFTQQTLSIVAELTEAAWLLPYSSRVDSITNFQHTIADGDDLFVDDLVPEPATASREQLTAAQQIAIAEPSLLNKLISPSAHVTGINVTFQLPGESRDENPQVVEASRALIKTIAEKYSSVDIYVTGRVMNNTAFREASVYDLTHIVPLAFAIAFVCIALYMYSASASIVSVLSGTLAIFIVVVTSIVTAMGISAWMGIELSPPVANAPTMVLTLAIADSIHIFATFFQQFRSGKTKFKSLVESLRQNQQPVFLTSITTMIGFLTMNFSDSPPFRDLGNVVAIGVMAAWLLSILLLPALIMLLPIRSNKRVIAVESKGSKLAEFAIQNKTPLFITFSLFIVGSSLFITNNQLNDVWAEYFDERTEVRKNGDFIRQNLTSQNSVEFSLRSFEEGAISDPAFLRKTAQFAEWLETQNEVNHVLTFTDTMKRLNKTMHGDDPSWYKLPDERELAAQYLLLYEMSLPFGLDLTNQIDMSKSSTRVIASIKDSSSATVLRLQEKAQAWLSENAPSYMYHPGTSPDLMFAQIGRTNIKSMLEGTLLALVVISILLGIALRSFRYGLISLLPNLIPAAVAFGLWGLMDGEIGLGLSAVAGMTLGIVVDYTVHFMSKYLRAKRENGLSQADAIRYAFSTVGTALIVTTLILTANFGVLAFSDFSLNADMGLLTAMTIVIALAIDFFFLPPLLLLLGSKRAASKQHDLRREGRTGSGAAVDSNKEHEQGGAVVL